MSLRLVLFLIGGFATGFGLGALTPVKKSGMNTAHAALDPTMPGYFALRLRLPM